MADKKITQLPSLSFISGSNTGYYAGEVVLPIVHNSTTVKMEAQKFALYATQWSATTASNTFIGNQTVNGNVIVTGKITAEEFFTEITSASIIFQSGSTLFGNSSDDIHTFTGTININGKVVGNAPLDFTSQSLNTQTGSQESTNLRISSVTGSMNTQSSSQDSVNYRNSTVTSSLNLSTASLNFTTGALNIASGSYNRFYQVTASVHSTTASLNQATSSLNFASGALNIATSSLNFASGALNIATGSYNKFYDMTSSVHFTTQSLNVQTGSQDTINFNISKVTASIDAHILGISIYTASLISQTNTIATFTSSVNFATASLNNQTGSQDLVNRGISSVTGSINAQSSSQDLVNRRISSVTGSMNTQSSSQDSVNYQNSIVTSSFRNEIGGIEAYTASLKSAIVVNGTNVRIIGELTASRIYTEFITSSVLFVTGSNIIGDQSTDKHEFTGSVNINDTLFIKGQAIGLGELNAFTGSQIGKDGTLAIVTSSLRAEIGGIESYTASLKGQAIVSSSTQVQNYDVFALNSNLYNGTGSIKGEVAGIESYTASLKAAAIVSSSTQIQNYDVFALNSNLYNGTGSIKGEVAGIEAYTASLKAAAIVSSSTQVQNYNLFALNSNLYTSTGSIKGEIAGLEAYTASLKGAAIVSSSQQITNYYKFAETASANTFYGNQSVRGNVIINAGNSLRLYEPTNTNYWDTYTYTDNTLRVNYNGAGGDEIILYNDGGINFSGALTASIYKVNNGGGIDFSANTGGAGKSSQLLDDYEEGTIAGTITCGTSGTVTLDAGYNTLSYTKIGGVVHVFGNLSVTSVSSPVGYFTIPLPFACVNLADSAGTTVANIVVNGTNTANTSDFVGWIDETQSNVIVRLGNATGVQNTSANELKALTDIYLQVTYRTT